MTNDEIIREFSALPTGARREVMDFIAFLRRRYAPQDPKPITINLVEESFVGIWKDREDIQDSSVFVREMRESE